MSAIFDYSSAATAELAVTDSEAEHSAGRYAWI
jgi:hypothetical protein